MFKGNIYRLVDNWYKFVPIYDYKDRPIKYLEIGVFNGANIDSVSGNITMKNEATTNTLNGTFSANR